MKKNIIWICNKGYLLPTYLSIKSFVYLLNLNSSTNNIRLVLIYCDKIDSFIQNLFQKFCIDIVEFRNDTKYQFYQEHIINRLARFYAARFGNEEDINILIDSDTLFNGDINLFIKEFDIPLSEQTIWGNIEYLNSLRDYLSFNKDSDVSINKEKIDCYNGIFGENWEDLLESVQFNNGLLGFYKCYELINTWESFFLKGLSYSIICPKEDQVPLAAAIQKQHCNIIPLDNSLNSKGIINGNYTMFHAYGGRWQSEFKLALHAIHTDIDLHLSDFALIAKKHLSETPTVLLKALNQEPFIYLCIPGYFRYDDIYLHIIPYIQNGHIVEIGTYKGRSACFLAEIVKQSKKKIQIDCIDNYSWNDTSPEITRKHLKEVGMIQYINIINDSSLNAVNKYQDQSLDLVFFDGDTSYESAIRELNAWYPKIKLDGYLAGDDYSTSRRHSFGIERAVNEFAKSHYLNIEIVGRGYIIKINKTIKK